MEDLLEYLSRSGIKLTDKLKIRYYSTNNGLMLICAIPVLFLRSNLNKLLGKVEYWSDIDNCYYNMGDYIEYNLDFKNLSDESYILILHYTKGKAISITSTDSLESTVYKVMHCREIDSINACIDLKAIFSRLKCNNLIKY